MDASKALKVAIEALKKEKKTYAVDANLAKHFGADNPVNIAATKKVAEIEEAIKRLAELGRYVKK